MESKYFTAGILMILLVSMAAADIVPKDSHFSKKCVRFVGLNDFQDVILIGYYTGPMMKGYKAYVIEEGECLQKGDYKFNKLNVYWTTREKFATMDLEDLDLSKLNLLFEDVDCWGHYVENSNPVINETVEYSIAGYTEKGLFIYKSKQIFEFNNGKEKEVRIFENPFDNNKSTKETQNVSVPSKDTGFWERIICFFRELFSKGC